VYADYNVVSPSSIHLVNLLRLHLNFLLNSIKKQVDGSEHPEAEISPFIFKKSPIPILLRKSKHALQGEFCLFGCAFLNNNAIFFKACF